MTEKNQADLRVAMLGAFPPQAQGVQDYCREIALALAAYCRVHALGFRAMYPAFLFPGVKQAMDPTKARMEHPNLTVEHRLTWYNPLGWLRTAYAVQADVFHAQWWSLPLFPVTYTIARAMKLRGIPLVVTAHNVSAHEGGGGYRRASGVLFRMADRVLVHSEANRARLIEQYALPEDKAVQVAIGAYMGDVKAVPRDEALRALELPPDKRYVLSFGTIRPYKGVDDLIEAFAQIAPNHPEVDLLIAGKPWAAWEPYAQQIEAHGLRNRVHLFLDYIPENRVRLFFSAADVTVLPYRHFDAQSGVCAVAMPYRKPVIVSEVGGLPEWVDRDLDWVVPAQAPAVLAERLAAFFRNRETKTTAFVPLAEKVLHRFSWEGIAARHLNVYQEFLR